ncbi:uncharacterized protein LOC133518805 [Cydia pomonella]|uniref:uncharacterized protein LOC133518805 n=1 Tax=Cydia pomonella TaxID=82600 RepID=UPI002ADD4E4C|nr:uncharacterized protein LOC133518805 [Cydia pomonella]
MFKKTGLCVLLFLLVSLFTVALCFQEDDATKPIRMAENMNKEDSLILQRIKRQLFRPGFAPVIARARAPTVIVVPERGTANYPVYGNVPMSPYSVNNPNRGTTVVVSQIPEYNYNGIGRTYGVPTL